MIKVDVRGIYSKPCKVEKILIKSFWFCFHQDFEPLKGAHLSSGLDPPKVLGHRRHFSGCYEPPTSLILFVIPGASGCLLSTVLYLLSVSILCRSTGYIVQGWCSDCSGMPHTSYSPEGHLQSTIEPDGCLQVQDL